MYYRALDRARQEIRLLKVHSGAKDDPVNCSLAHASLADAPEYSALSYVWGDPHKLAHLVVDGTALRVTSNLEIALRHVRSSSEDLTLWVDAVCINQENVEERNEQVAMMGEIYASATSVLIWIGQADATSDAAFDTMPVVLTQDNSESVQSELGSFYLGLNERPWFYRLWIMQELALATADPFVLCGTKRVAWSTFVAAWKQHAETLFADARMSRPLNDEKEGPGGEILAKIKPDLLEDLRSTVREQGGSSLRRLLLFSRTSEATEAKDRIYALVGMLGKEDRGCFTIDYRKPIAVVYAEAMAHIFSTGDGPNFLSGMRFADPASTVPGLPSWVPDFSAQTGEKSTFSSPIKFHPPHPRSASGPGASAINGEVQADGKTLEVRALPVDVIEEVVYFEHTLSGCVKQLPHIGILAACARKRELLVSETLRPFFDRYRRSEPLWRTLVSDKKRNSGYDAAPEPYEAEFRALVAIREEEAPLLPGDELDSTLPVAGYRQALDGHLPGQAFFTTRNGLVGLGTPSVQAGDQVTIWFGATVPFVMRACRGDETCKLVGAAYVAGIMNGEMVDELYCEDLLDEVTLLVV
ncbi:hypothetical protein LTR17_009031 [Elasticomyces elasticus]|nr:hypothetical protein LTR17_009031 [Elasticomyces elasticus]